MQKNNVKKIVAAYAEELSRHDFPFSQILLFGSYAKGTAKEWSDIDICVVSNKFKGKQWDENERQLWKLKKNVDARIEPIGMTPEDLKSWSPLAHEIRKHGVRIK